jgi:hypothetical protein
MGSKTHNITLAVPNVNDEEHQDEYNEGTFIFYIL